MAKEFGGIIISPGCSNMCVFCTGQRIKCSKSQLKEQEINAARNIVQLLKKGIRKIEISGCDPGEYKSIAKLAKYLKEKGFKFVVLSTHGINLAGAKLRKEIIRSGIDKIRIPIYGSSAEVHDSVTRNKGSFEKAIEGIKSLRQESKKIELQISSLILKQNINDLEGISRLSKSLGADSFYFSVPCIVGPPENYYVPIKDLGPYLKRVIGFCSKEKIKVEFIEIPYCVFGFYSREINNKSLPPDLGDHCQPQEEFRTEIRDMPAYRRKTKVKMCVNCKCNSFCDGFFERDIKRFGTGKLKPIE